MNGPSRGKDAAGGVTIRALLIALGLLFILAPIAFFIEFRWDITDMFVGVPSLTPVVVLFLLTALASRSILRRKGFSRKELLVVYSILLVVGPLIGRTTTGWMLAGTIHYYFMSRLKTIWKTLFLNQVPSWFSPTDQFSIEKFFQGQAGVPWSTWIAPLSAWSGFMIALFLCSLCIHALLQRQWITNERLSFPLAQVPLGMVEESSQKIPGLPASRMFWAGLIVSFGVNCINGLSARFPAVPAIPLGPVTVRPAIWEGSFAGMAEITLVFWPWMIGIAYLLPKDLSFSTWFFWWLLVAANIIGAHYGLEARDPAWMWDSKFPAPRFQGIGAMLSIGFLGFWIARGYFFKILRNVFSKRSEKENGSEPLPYRLALFGLFLTFFAMCSFLWIAGGRILFGLVVIAGILGYYVVWARLRAETGLGFSMFPLELEFFLVTPLGPSVFNMREKVILNAVRWTYGQGFGSIYEVISGNTLEAFKIADSAGLNKRRLTAGVVGVFLVILMWSITIILTGIYRYGWLNLKGLQSGWFGQSLTGGDTIVWRTLESSPGPDTGGILAILFGAGFALLLEVMRLRFWRWPFHPVGYMAAMCWGLNWWWMPFFIGWIFKTLITRYGGLWLHRKTVPLAVGMIVGDLLNKGAWAFVGLLTQGYIKA